MALEAYAGRHLQRGDARSRHVRRHLEPVVRTSGRLGQDRYQQPLRRRGQRRADAFVRDRPAHALGRTFRGPARPDRHGRLRTVRRVSCVDPVGALRRHAQLAPVLRPLAQRLRADRVGPERLAPNRQSRSRRGAALHGLVGVRRGADAGPAVRAGCAASSRDHARQRHAERVPGRPGPVDRTLHTRDSTGPGAGLPRQAGRSGRRDRGHAHVPQEGRRDVRSRARAVPRRG